MDGRQKEGGRMERERRMEGGMEEAWGGRTAIVSHFDSHVNRGSRRLRDKQKAVRMVSGRIRTSTTGLLTPIAMCPHSCPVLPYHGPYPGTPAFTAPTSVPAREWVEGTCGLGGCHRHPRALPRCWTLFQLLIDSPRVPI